jgi:hypothetical protein
MSTACLRGRYRHYGCRCTRTTTLPDTTRTLGIFRSLLPCVRIDIPLSTPIVEPGILWSSAGMGSNVCSTLRHIPAYTDCPTFRQRRPCPQECQHSCHAQLLHDYASAGDAIEELCSHQCLRIWRLMVCGVLSGCCNSCCCCSV